MIILTRLGCHNCQVHLTFTCTDQASLDLRQETLLLVLNGFDHLAECQSWLQHTRDHGNLRGLMFWLFPLPALLLDNEKHDRNIRCMISAFTDSQCTNSLNRLGIKKPVSHFDVLVLNTSEITTSNLS